MGNHWRHEDQDDARSSAAAGSSDHLESLLASRAPDLQFDRPLNVHSADLEISSDGGEARAAEVVLRKVNVQTGLKRWP